MPSTRRSWRVFSGDPPARSEAASDAGEATEGGVEHPLPRSEQGGKVAQGCRVTTPICRPAPQSCVNPGRGTVDLPLLTSDYEQDQLRIVFPGIWRRSEEAPTAKNNQKQRRQSELSQQLLQVPTSRF